MIECATAFYAERGINISSVNPLSDELAHGAPGTELKQKARGRYAIHPRYYRKGATRHPLFDASGNSIKSTRQAMRAYAVPFEYKPQFPLWAAFEHFKIRGGTLEVETENEGCRVSLLHDYIVQWTLWAIIFPVDGDPGFPESNGRLEREYLLEIQRHLNAH